MDFCMLASFALGVLAGIAASWVWSMITSPAVKIVQIVCDDRGDTRRWLLEVKNQPIWPWLKREPDLSVSGWLTVEKIHGSEPTIVQPNWLITNAGDYEHISGDRHTIRKGDSYYIEVASKILGQNRARMLGTPSVGGDLLVID